MAAVEGKLQFVQQEKNSESVIFGFLGDLCKIIELNGCFRSLTPTSGVVTPMGWRWRDGQKADDTPPCVMRDRTDLLELLFHVMSEKA